MCIYIYADQDFDKSKVLEFTYTIVVITKPFGIMRKDIKATENETFIILFERNYSREINMNSG